MRTHGSVARETAEDGFLDPRLDQSNWATVRIGQGPIPGFCLFTTCISREKGKHTKESLAAAQSPGYWRTGYVCMDSYGEPSSLKLKTEGFLRSHVGKHEQVKHGYSRKSFVLQNDWSLVVLLDSRLFSDFRWQRHSSFCSVSEGEALLLTQALFALVPIALGRDRSSWKPLNTNSWDLSIACFLSSDSHAYALSCTCHFDMEES